MHRAETDYALLIRVKQTCILRIQVKEVLTPKYLGNFFPVENLK